MWRRRWGSTLEPISTQVIPRDRHAMFFATLGVVAASIERLAIEIRHLQRTEVLEAEEFFSEGQKGSSAMPHKRNPVLSENLTGLARMVRAYVTPALENVALWHERDISHSSVERMIGPDATVTLDFALVRLTGLIDKLLVYPENMQKNLDRLGGLDPFAARAARADAEGRRARGGLSAGAAQRHAGLARRRRLPHAAQGRQGRDASYLSEAEIEANFDLGYHLKHVDTIFRRVFGDELSPRPCGTPLAAGSRPHCRAPQRRDRSRRRAAPVRAVSPPRTRGCGARRRRADRQCRDCHARLRRRPAIRRPVAAHAGSPPAAGQSATALPVAGATAMPARGHAPCRRLHAKRGPA